jgi:hypothetical protein
MGSWLSRAKPRARTRLSREGRHGETVAHASGTATQTATLRPRTADPVRPSPPSFPLHTSTKDDTRQIAGSRRSAMMMSADAKFALGY